MEKTINVREIVDAYQVNCDRIQAIADACEKEQRERNDAENAEYEALVRKNQVLQMRMSAAANENMRKNPNAVAEAAKIVRENIAAGRQTKFLMVRDLMMVSDVTTGGVVPIKVQDILEPLEEGLIIGKLGLPMPTGLAGDYVWPVYEAVDANIAGEGVELSDTKIPMSKLTAAPQRIGLAVPVTRQSLNQSEGVLEMIVKKVMPAAVVRLLNKILLSTEAVNGATTLVGPFVGKAENAVSLSSVPTFAELNGMKAKVLETGVDGENLCFVMTKAQAAILEGTPINSKGIFRPMIENGMLCGVPVFTSNELRKVVTVGKKYTSGNWVDYTIQTNDTVAYTVTGDSEANALATIKGTPTANSIAEVTVVTEYIGLGDWRYQPMGLFGDIRFTVDPYSQARKDAVDFVLNCDYGTKTLRPEAFALGVVSAAD